MIYLRMSLDKSGEGAGIERQEVACRALAASREWDVVEVIDDTISATKVRAADRPGWAQVLGLIERNAVDVVVTWHLDRITRTMVDLEELITLSVDHGVGITTATGDIDLTTDVGRMVSRILAAVARAEIERKSARQVLANEQRAVAGRSMWVRRPFGYELDGSLREAEAVVIRQAYSDLLGGRSLSAITRDFEASGLATTGSAKVWGLATVRANLRSARNAALSTYYGDVVAKATWEPIVDEAIWRAAERLLGDPSRHRGQGPLANLLTGIATCDVCGGGIKVGWRGRKGEPGSYSIYQCIVGHATLPVEFAEGVVVRELVKRAEEMGTTALAPSDSPDVTPLRSEAATLHERMAVLAEDFAEGNIERSALLAGSTRLRTRLAELEAEIAVAGRTGVWNFVDVEHLYEEFELAPLETQRSIVRAAFTDVVIRSRGKGRIPPTQEHVKLSWTPEWERSA